MASQGLQSYSSFLLENRKELAILLLLGAVAGAAYYFFHYSQPQEIIPLEERGVLDLQQITINDYQHEQKSNKTPDPDFSCHGLLPLLERQSLPHILGNRDLNLNFYLTATHL